MFSGIVEETGSVLSVHKTSDGTRFKIGADNVLSDLGIGDSISVSGVCLTAVEKHSQDFVVEATIHTLATTNLKELKIGDSVNLERALKMSDRLGGHFVTGHIDGVAIVKNIVSDGFARKVYFDADTQFAGNFVEKGSVCLDGVSLTISIVDAPAKDKRLFRFGVVLIPHTMQVTTLGKLKAGDQVNLEVDMLSKLVSRQLALMFGNNTDYPLNLNKEDKMPALLSEYATLLAVASAE